ncbi:MAG: multicopper oxidase domain-containing protein [Methylococcaceae bacterium]|nr:multicopper oxidase domain-containing protein [Methylococcaceae bacterium]
MKILKNNPLSLLAAGIFCAYTILPGTVKAQIQGVQGPTFSLSAGIGYIDTPDGGSLQIWGYSSSGHNNNLPQYPGPTLIVNQGDIVTVNLTNNLAENVSMLFPGQGPVSSSCTPAPACDGDLTKEAVPNQTNGANYTFTAGQPGTYMYYSGTNMQVQMEMGLFGVLIVRPGGFDSNAPTAYDDALNISGNGLTTAYDHEYLFLLSEMDPEVHYRAEAGTLAQWDNSTYHPVLWFINGRNGPDTLSGDFLPWMPHQPYGSLVRTHATDTVLTRVASASRNMHPFHFHGNNFDQLARDGRLLQSAPDQGPDLAMGDYTLQALPGATYEVTWSWTGKDLGWDILGTAADGASDHLCNGNTVSDGTALDFDPVTHEYCPDHNKTISGLRNALIPGLGLKLPEKQDLTFGGFYSGTPFLGGNGALPPGEGGLNPTSGLFFMWHSHAEKELINNDIFPGGMLTMMVVEPYDVLIP